jgi:hypothetical protein
VRIILSGDSPPYVRKESREIHRLKDGRAGRGERDPDGRGACSALLCWRVRISRRQNPESCRSPTGTSSPLMLCPAPSPRPSVPQLRGERLQSVLGACPHHPPPPRRRIAPARVYPCGRGPRVSPLAKPRCSAGPPRACTPDSRDPLDLIRELLPRAGSVPSLRLSMKRIHPCAPELSAYHGFSRGTTTARYLRVREELPGELHDRVHAACSTARPDGQSRCLGVREPAGRHEPVVPPSLRWRRSIHIVFASGREHPRATDHEPGSSLAICPRPTCCRLAAVIERRVCQHVVGT